MVRFDAPKLIGPVPQAGRMVETIEARGKHLEVMWDDGIVLDTHLKGKSEWHVYRQGSPWRRSWEKLRASIQTDDFVAVCFDAPVVETYRQPDRERHPGRGRLGPDLTRVVDCSEAVDLLLSYPDREARLRDVLVDQHVMQGVGNVYRCEVLWAAELSPWAHIGDLTQHDASADRQHRRQDAPGQSRAGAPCHHTTHAAAASPCTVEAASGASDVTTPSRPAPSAAPAGCCTGAPVVRSGSTGGSRPRCVTSIRTRRP